ncbi:MAG: rRNA maturation RNase YbeY [Bacteroidetes bacterium]|nr:rRNA maturation RNase YbeY [Bacteroidota bacterium]
MKKSRLSDPEIEVAIAFRAPLGSLGAQLFQEIIRFTLMAERIRKAVISCAIVTDAEIRMLNKRFLQHDYSTDVITFPLEESPLEAELVLSAETARRQAREYRVPLREECTRLAIHGMLHLCGYDDRAETDRARMREREDVLLRRFLSEYRRNA